MAKEHPRYATTEFPDYEYREFPLMIYPGSADGGKTPDRHPTKAATFLQDPVIVRDEEERWAVLEISEPALVDAAFKPNAAKLVDIGGGTKRLATEDDVKAELLQEAETLGLKVDRRWSVARLEDEIATHKANEVV